MSECYCGVDHAAEDAAREAREEAAEEIARLRSGLEERDAEILRVCQAWTRTRMWAKAWKEAARAWFAWGRTTTAMLRIRRLRAVRDALRSELEEERGAHIDLLMDVWQQFALPVPEVMAGRSGVAMDGGLSTLEDVAEVLVAAGRLVLVSDKYDWYALASVGGGDAGKGEGEK